MTFLVGSTATNGANVGLNLLQRRGWNFTVATTGVADTLYFKANATTTYKFGIYAIPTISAAPVALLATTVDVVAVAGNTYSVPLSVGLSLTAGQFVNITAKALSGGSHFQATSAVTCNQRTASANDASYATAMADPFGSQNGATASTPAIWLESTVVSITALDRLLLGSVSTATLNDAGFAATNAKITADTITKTVATSGTAPTFTFTPPSWVNGDTALKYGSASTVLNNGTTDTTANTSVAVTIAAPFAFVDLTSVSADSLDKIGSFSPAWAINTQIVYDSSKITVYANGECDTLIFDGVYWVDSGFEGVTQVWGRDPTDKIARVSNVTISAGAPVVTSGGLTTRGLTFSGTTVRGLTVTGL